MPDWVEQVYQDMRRQKEAQAQKGGPGSGHWGHAGRPGKRGGSIPGRGAAYNRSGWLVAVRNGYPRPIRDEIAKKVRALHPDITGHEVDMYLDVMAMDHERFLYYANKLGMENPEDAMRAYFAENDEAEGALLRRRLEMEEKATFSQKGQPKDQLEAYGKIWDDYHRVREGTAQELAGAIKKQYGVEIQNDNGTPDEIVRQNASYILNVAEAHPALATILKEQVKRIHYMDPRGGDLATARWNDLNGSIELLQPRFCGPGVLVHEMGHAAEEYVGGTSKLDALGFGRGRTASSYGWTNHHEDWAEWFLSVIDNEPGIAQWEPAKYDYVRGLIDKLGG